jgi:hypothetical protein
MPKFLLEASVPQTPPTVTIGLDTPPGSVIYVPEYGSSEALLLLVLSSNPEEVKVVRWRGNLTDYTARFEQTAYIPGSTLRNGSRILGPNDRLKLTVEFA